MQKKNLSDVGKDLKLRGPDDDSHGPGRKPGSLGSLPNLKTMSKKDLISELGRRRKENKDLLEINQKLSVSAPSAAIKVPGEMLAAVPVLIFEFMASRFGDHWQLSEPEALAYGESLSDVIDRYLPEIAGNRPELTALGLLVVVTALPRGIKSFKDYMAGKNEIKNDASPKSGDKSGGD